MKIVKHKWFWAWSFEKEEKWLNQMSSRGWQLTDVGFCRYVFEEGTPNEYEYHIELLENSPSGIESQRYISFLEETGIQMVGSYMRWIYLRKKQEDGPFELYSDLESRIQHLKRIIRLFIFLLPLEFFVGASNIGFGVNKWNDVTYSNLFMGIVCILLGLLLTFGAVKLGLKCRKMRREAALYER